MCVTRANMVSLAKMNRIEISLTSWLPLTGDFLSSDCPSGCPWVSSGEASVPLLKTTLSTSCQIGVVCLSKVTYSPD